MNEPNRIEIESEGLGEISDADLEKRARQIAHSDGRATFNELDRAEALRELTGPITREAPEEQMAESDRPEAGAAPASTGAQAKRSDLDDEASVTADLVREGVEEADFDTRVNAGHGGRA